MALLNAGKRVLLVGSEGIALFGPTARGVERETTLSWEVPNFDQVLTEALTEQNQGVPVFVLFDAADQTYRKEENVPKLGFFDRERFIQRKLNMAFPSYPVRASILIKPPTGRGVPKEEPSYLFVAIPDTTRLDRIGDNMLEAGVPVAGFGLLPAESEGLVTALSTKLFTKSGRKSRWAVLIGQHETGGLRQVVVKDGNLALTRMTPVSEAGIQGPGWVEEVMREFKATLTYIARFGYSAEEGLDVIIICGEIERQFFDQRAMPVSNFQCLKVGDALAAIAARGVSLGETNFADALHAAWASRKRSLAVPVKVPSIQRIMGPRLVARIGMVVLTLVMLGFFGVSVSAYQDYSRLEDDIKQKGIQKEKLQAEYEESSKIFNQLPVKPPEMKGMLAVKTLVDGSSINIAPVMHVLRKTLENDIKLSQLTLEHSLPGDLKSGAPEAKLNTVKVSFKLTITGASTLEQKVTRMERLETTLRQVLPGYEVKLLKQFGNISRTGKFGGEAGKDPASEGVANQEDSAEFELRGAPL